MPYYVHLALALLIAFFAHAQWQCWMIYSGRLAHPQIGPSAKLAATSLPKWLVELGSIAALLGTADWMFAPIVLLLYAVYRFWWAFIFARAQPPFEIFMDAAASSSRRARVVSNVLWASVGTVGSIVLFRWLSTFARHA